MLGANLILYHYTTISALISIITRRELWASDCQYLNDGTELKYAEDKFFAEIDKLKLPELEDGGYNIPWRSSNYWRMFVTCFCEDEDLLSQWRGYGTNQGYALGFDSEGLSAAGIGDLIQIQYGLDDPTAYFAEELKIAPTGTAHPGVRANYLTGELLPRLAGVKHPRFKEEREWRLMRKNETGLDDNIKVQYRPSSLGPVPYIVNKFPIGCLREIIVGPGEYSEVRREGLELMIWTEGLINSCQVRLSEIPLRS